MLGQMKYIDFLGAVQPVKIRVTRPLPRLRIGARVSTPLGDAFVQNIAVSPYWHEERQGIKRVYVYSTKWVLGDKWVEWFLVDEIEVLS